MARLLPSQPPTKLPKDTLKVFEALKTLPDHYFIWHHLAPWEQSSPDFLIVTYDAKVLLVKVCPAVHADVQSAVQMRLFGEPVSTFGKMETEVLERFVEKLNFPQGIEVATLVLFPNLPDARVQELRHTFQITKVYWAGKELLEGREEPWKAYFSNNPLPPLFIEKVRQQFSPEIVVPSHMTVRPQITRRLEAGLTDYLLDYDQERAVKSDLDLPEEDESLLNDFRLNIINGVAGSGKTLILIYRLRLLYNLYPQKRFLVLTHNRPLNFDMQARFARLNGGKLPENIEWFTFNGWCYHYWPRESEKWIEPIRIKPREQLAEEVCRKYLQDLPISTAMFLSEIDWIKDQLPMTREEYLQADRRGRGFGLSAEQRRRVFDAFSAYQQKLAEENLLDWGDVPQKMWNFLQDGTVVPPQYDVVMIDEAQFFAPLWMQIVKKLLKPGNSHLFIVADPTQGFLGRGGSWKALGIQARGRTHTLRKSYRTTLEILQFATLFYRTRVTEDPEEDILSPDLLNMPNGVLPEILLLSSSQDEIVRVANEVKEFVSRGYPKKHLLLLHTSQQGVTALVQAINSRLGKDAARDAKNDYPGDYVRVTTLNAGAGLESPIVFLVGLRELFEQEQSLRLSDDERETLIRDNTRKLYMAITRAGQRLVLTHVGEPPEVLSKIQAQLQSA
ncbi:UvrD-helicase domain-containing protein [Anaerolinea thermophila]|uniref:UvrD-like helicase ATP-binding domain-containing protein n=1 Tax=Anaerolinea thermophila (strain DSM 14523 / JCM 11388 / NBRC 100420 / UNI-1) TaxID=926569 RepID=E8N3T8_ANATU|nr:UvrD-helicase domain-containing protein [Anaerolinea thermophila]BAJ63102.1 hypothetical protein ANT_10680 [Anaerolinea thermophila UNI-1]